MVLAGAVSRWLLSAVRKTGSLLYCDAPRSGEALGIRVLVALAEHLRESRTRQSICDERASMVFNCYSHLLSNVQKGAARKMDGGRVLISLRPRLENRLEFRPIRTFLGLYPPA